MLIPPKIPISMLAVETESGVSASWPEAEQLEAHLHNQEREMSGDISQSGSSLSFCALQVERVTRKSWEEVNNGQLREFPHEQRGR